MWSVQPARSSTRAWRCVRARVLARDQVCQLRLAVCTVVPTEVDHIVAPGDGGTEAEANLRAVCHACHAIRTGRQAAAARTGRRRRPPEPHPGLSGAASVHRT
jgi:5-methylcytosine-specific restriction protein A